MPLGPLSQPFDLGLEFAQLFPVRSRPLVRSVELFTQGEEPLRVLGLEFVRVGQFGTGGCEFGFEARDQGGSDGSVGGSVRGQ